MTVVGLGETMIEPDGIVIRGDITGRSKEYREAVERSAEVVTALRKNLGDNGFDWNDLKTTDFSVRPAYEFVREGDVQRRVFDGYEYSHSVRLEIDADNELLGRALSAIADSKDAPEFSISYYVKDASAPAKEARRLAVKDAKRKAKELADVADVKLGEIVGISYGSQESVHAPRAMRLAMDAPNIVPESVRFSDSVKMEWEII